MNRKLNYIFSQVLDNYSDAYGRNTAFYVGFGFLFIFVNVGVYLGQFFFDFSLFNSFSPQYNKSFISFTYLLFLILPCLATLRNEEQHLKFWPMLIQNAGIFLVLIVLAVIGFFFISFYENEEAGRQFIHFNESLRIMGDILTSFIVLSLLRISIQKRIALLDGLVDALMVTILLVSLIDQFQSLFAYELIKFLNDIGRSNLGEMVMFLYFFLLINQLLSPFLVTVITAVVRYEEETETIREVAGNETL